MHDKPKTKLVQKGSQQTDENVSLSFIPTPACASMAMFTSSRLLTHILTLPHKKHNFAAQDISKKLWESETWMGSLRLRQPHRDH